MGDLAGPCIFSILMGSARVLHAKSTHIPLRTYMMNCGVLCLLGYAVAGLSASAVLSLMGCALVGFSVGVMWPGTLSLASQRMRGGSTAMYALLALAGDVGCSGGPTLVGLLSAHAGNSLKVGICAAMVFPVMLLIGLLLLRERGK